MAEPSRGESPRLSVREVVEALDDPLQRRGFERRNPFMVEATASDHWVASWLRMPSPKRTTVDGVPIPPIGYDGVSVWSDGYINVGMVDNSFHTRLEWRTSPLDAAEFACVVAGVVDQVDRFIPHTGPPLRREFFTRDD